MADRALLAGYPRKAPVMQYTPTSFQHQRKTIKQERQECNTGSAANTACWTILFMQVFVEYSKQKSEVIKWFQDVHYIDITWWVLWHHWSLKWKGCQGDSSGIHWRQCLQWIPGLSLWQPFHFCESVTLDSFFQQLVQADNKDNIKVLHHWPFVRGIPWRLLVFLTTGQ